MATDLPVAVRVSDLSVGYNKKTVASKLFFSIPKGTVTALLGANGVGKSTILKTITGELPPLSGEIYLCGRLLQDYTRKEISRLLSIVTTDHVLAGGLTVKELVELGRQPHTGILGRLGHKDHQIAAEAMRKVGISHKSDSYVAELSDGERQKVMIAKALAQDTPLIFLDEPFSFLDVAARIEILSLMRIFAREGKTVLFSSHDVSQALRMASLIMLFTADRKIVSGHPLELIADGSMDRLFHNESIRFSSRQNDFVEKQNAETAC